MYKLERVGTYKCLPACLFRLYQSIHHMGVGSSNILCRMIQLKRQPKNKNK